LAAVVIIKFYSVPINELLWQYVIDLKTSQLLPLAKMFLRPFDSSKCIWNKLQFFKRWDCENQERFAQQERWGIAAL